MDIKKTMPSFRLGFLFLLFISLVLSQCSSSRALDDGHDAGSDGTSDTIQDTAGKADEISQIEVGGDTHEVITDLWVDTDSHEFSCDDWNPYAEVNPNTAEPCNPEQDKSRDCTSNDKKGFQRCLYFTVAEDTGVHRWGPCEEECSAADMGKTRPCQVNDIQGIQYCDSGVMLPQNAYIWNQCLLMECVVCTPGETEKCGAGTNYPDSLKACILSNGVPYWFDGNCWT